MGCVITRIKEGNSKFIGALLFILVAASALLWWFFFEQPLNPWVPANVEFTSDCGVECVVVKEPSPRKAFTHGNSLGFSYNPKVDDAVAQWGDCIESVVSCINKGGEAYLCISASQCPAECINRYQQQLGGSPSEDTALDAFETVFIQPGAVCRPERKN